MAKIKSAGTLLYKFGESGLEVLLVHPSGESNKKSPWSIPKGRLDKGETPEEAARRETLEETGITCPEILVDLGFVVYKSKKQVYCYCGEAASDSNPTCASWEIDQAMFVPVDEAEGLLHSAQKEFIQRIKDHVGSSCGLCRFF